MIQALIASTRARYSDHSLAVYLAPLLDGQRVGVVGPASGDIARRCRAVGAQTVIAFGGTGEGIAVRPLTPGVIESFHGKLDIVLVPDASAVPLASVLDEARRALGQDGIVVVASQQAESHAGVLEAGSANGPGYYELHDALSSRFGTVQMLGRGPFLAYTFAALGGEHEGITLDTRLLPDEAPQAEAFVAVACDHRVSLDAISLVQIPAAEFLRREPTVPPPAETHPRVDELESKVRDAENTSAERWVRVQRLEHENKALEEEARKARDRAAKLAKELDDERKARQRVELDAQMARRGQDLPKADPEELKAARDRAAQLERELERAKTDGAGAQTKLAALERELDEAQEAEAALRTQLDAAEKKGARHGEDGEFVRMERELFARANEVIELRTRVEERDAAIRELSFALERESETAVAKQAQAARERVAELSALNAGLASETSSLLHQNDLLRERLGKLEAEMHARADEIAAWERNKSALEARAAAAESGPRSDGELTALRAQLEEARSREASALEAVRMKDAREVEMQSRQQMLERALAEERENAGVSGRHLAESRTEQSRQAALLASFEDGIAQKSLELEGARAGYTRRVRELEREVEQLVQALEVVGAHSSDEDARVDALVRDMDILRAEKNGTQFRLRDAEAALAARLEHAGAATAPLPGAGFEAASEEGHQVEQLLSDLAETAAKLADTEEALHAAREATNVAENRAEESARQAGILRAELDAMRVTAPPPVDHSSADVESLQRESAEKELLVRSLVAQLEDRDLRLRALERRLVEEVERARRTESEIWEVELRSRDQRIVNLTRDVERARTATPAPPAGANGGESKDESASLRAALEGRERQIRDLRTSIEQVRAGLSSILVDGRGAVIAHDLVNLLRQIDESQAG